MPTPEIARNAQLSRWKGKNDSLARAYKFNDDARAIFLEHLANTNRWYDSAAAAGVSYQCVKDTMKADEHFSSQCEIAQGLYRNRLYAEAERRAVEGVDEPVFYEGAEVGSKRRYSDQLLTLLLKRNDPSFRDNLTVSGGIDIQVGVLAVTAGSAAKSEEEWSSSHGGEKLQDDRLPMVDGEATVIEE